jgi:hypothetical protein
MNYDMVTPKKIIKRLLLLLSKIKVFHLKNRHISQLSSRKSSLEKGIAILLWMKRSLLN